MSAKFLTAKLTDIAELNPTLGKKLPAEELVSFVPMASLSAESASVETTQDRPYAEVAKGFTPFLDGDVLVAKITPCFENGKIAQARLPRSHGFGSTEFHVVRARSGITESRYLHHYLRLEEVRANGQRRMTGSGGQRRVPASFLADLAVPLPPLEEQRRIAAILDQTETLRTQRRTALALLDSLTQSLFLDMFGDMRVEPDRWPKVPFDAIVEDSRIGLVRGSQELDDSHPYPYLRMNAITRDGELKLEGALRATATAEELETYCLRHGDFLFNTRNSRELVGKTALFRGSELYLFNNNLLRVRFVESAHPEYVVAAFKTQYIQNELELRKSGTTNVFAVYYKDLRTLPIPLPPLPLQQTFATRIASIEALKATHRRALAALDALFASLQQRAFSGELALAAPRSLAQSLKQLQQLEASIGQEALIFIAKRMPNGDLYNSLKAIYFADRHHLEHHGRQIYNETYSALTHGPVPQAAYDATNVLIGKLMFSSFDDDAVRAALRRKGDTLTALRDADFSKLSRAVIESLEWGIRYCRDMKFGQTKTASHDSAYERTPKNEAIPLQYVIDTLPPEARQRHWGL